MTDTDIPGPGFGFAAIKGAIDYGYQTGDFETARGQSSRVEANFGRAGGSTQYSPDGNWGLTVSDPRVSFGLGFKIGQQHTSTNSFRLRDCSLCDKARDWWNGTKQ